MNAIERDRLALRRRPSASHAALQPRSEAGLLEAWAAEAIRREVTDSRASDIRQLFAHAPAVELTGDDFDAIRTKAIRRDELTNADEHARRDALERKRCRDELRAGPQWAEQLSRAKLFLICTVLTLAAFSVGYITAPSYDSARADTRAAEQKRCDAKLDRLSRQIPRNRLRDDLTNPIRRMPTD